MKREYEVRFDALDGVWFVWEGGFVEAGPFESEQDAYDWLESFGD